MVHVLLISPDSASYLYQVSRIYLNGFQSYSRADMVSLLKFPKGHNSDENVGEVTVLVL